MSWMQSDRAGVILNVRVMPGASRNDVSEILGDRLKIRLQCAPVKGKANKALTRFLGRKFGIPASRVSILCGEKARNKRVFLEGVDPSTAGETVMREASGS
jgi:hypothetical protein